MLSVYLSPLLRASAIHVIAVAMVFASCSKLDKDINCVNEASSCFKPDKTRPKFSSVAPPAGSSNPYTVLPQIDITFSEEVKNGEDKDAYFIDHSATFGAQPNGGINLNVASAQKVDKYTYRVKLSGSVTTGIIRLDYSKIRDYADNMVQGLHYVDYEGIASVPITVSVTYGANEVYGVSTNGNGAYGTINLKFSHQFEADNANTYNVYRTDGGVSCPPTGTFSSLGTGSNLQKGQDVNITNIPAATFTTVNDQIVICIQNQNNPNAKGTGNWPIIRDDSPPTISNASAATDTYRDPFSVTITCGDNKDKIAYSTAINPGTPTPPADPVDPDFTSGVISGGSLYTGAIPVINDTNPTVTKIRWRCVDKSGNKETVSKMITLTVDNTIPAVNVNLDSNYRAFVSTAVGAYNSTTLNFTSDQANKEFRIASGTTTCSPSGGGPSLIGAGPFFTNVVANGANAPQIINASAFAAGLNEVRICVQGPVATTWGTAYLQITRDDGPITATPSVLGGDYGSVQNVTINCSGNTDKIAYTVATQLGKTAPTPPLDPVFTAGAITVGSELTGPYATPDSSTTIIKYKCLDKAGNQSGVGQQQYRIDTTLPIVTWLSTNRTGVSLNAGAYQDATVTWSSTRAGLDYRIRRVADCNHAGDPGNTILSGTTPAVGVNEASVLPFGSFPTQGTTYPIRICVYNYVDHSTYQTATINITRDNVYPTYAGLTTLSSPASGSFTLNWASATDSGSNVAFYRIYQATTPGGPYSTPTYIVPAPATSFTITGLNPTTTYYFIAGAVDLAGNETKVTGAELASKPAITVAVTGLTGSFDLTDGTSTNTISTNSAGSPWTTTLSIGQNYSFSFNSQPSGQICSLRQKAFGALVSDLALTVECVNGQLVGGQYRAVPPSGLNYLLYRTSVQVKASGIIDANSLTVVGGFLYYGDYADCDGSTAGTQYCVYRLPVTSGGQTTFVTALPSAVRGITNDGTNLYFVTQAPDSRLYKRTIATGSAVEIASGLSNPYGIVTDGDAVFICNRGANEIVRVALATGAKTTIASGLAGGPIGISMTASDLYFTVWGSHAIYRVPKSGGAVTEVYGSAGVSGHQDNTGTAARFNQPHDLTYDGVDNLFVTDYQNSRVRKIRISTGRVTTLAGDGTSTIFNGGTGATAKLPLPVGITTDGASLYLSTHTDDRISKLVDSGHVGHWPLSNTTGLTDFNSAHTTTNNATWASGSASYGADRFGNSTALLFNGTNTQLQMTTPLTAGSACNLSVSVWFRITNPVSGNGRGILYNGNSGGSGYGFMVEPNGELSVLFGGVGSIGSKYIVQPNQWTHAAMVCKPVNRWQIYVNGRLMAEGDGSAVQRPNSNAVTQAFVGKGAGGATEFITGAVSDVRMYNRILSDAEINELAQDARDNPEVGVGYNRGATELMAHYEFNSGSSALESGSVGGALSFGGSTPTQVTGKDGDASGALHYNGSNDYYSATGTAVGLPSGDAPRTLCAWISPASYPGAGFKKIIMQYGDPAPTRAVDIDLFNNAGTIGIALSGYGSPSEARANFAVPLNTWTHVCGVYSGGTTAQIYANGQLLTLSQSITTPWVTTATPAQNFYIGRHLSNSTDHFPGKIDDVRIYNKALTALEIRRLAVQVPTGLVARYDLSDDVAGAKAVDTSGRGENLNIAGATQVPDRFGVSNQAYHFNGTTHNMTGSDASLPTGTSPRMMCAWIRPTAYPAAVWGHFVKYGNASVTGQMDAIMLKNGNQITHSFFAMDHDLTYPVPLNVWTHICGAYNGTTSLFYVNGGQIGGSGLSPNTVLAGNSGLVIGNAGYDTAQRFTGDIDDVRIYNRILSTNEMRAIAGYHPVQVTNGFTAMKMHYNPEILSTLANGADIAQWDDSSMAGLHMVQATAGDRPQYSATAINGRPAVNFTANRHFTRSCNTNLDPATVTIVGMMRKTDTSGGVFKGLFHHGDKLLYFNGANEQLAWFRTTPDEPRVMSVNSYITQVASGPNMLFSLTYDGSAGNIFKFGQDVTTGGPYATGSTACSTGLTFGKTSFAVNNFEGQIGDFVYYNTSLTAGDRRIAECYISAKYSVPMASGITCP